MLARPAVFALAVVLCLAASSVAAQNVVVTQVSGSASGVRGVGFPVSISANANRCGGVAAPAADAARAPCVPGTNVTLSLRLNTTAALSAALSVSVRFVASVVDSLYVDEQTTPYIDGRVSSASLFASGDVDAATTTLSVACPNVPGDAWRRFTLSLSDAASGAVQCIDFESDIGPFFEASPSATSQPTCTTLWSAGYASNYGPAVGAVPVELNDFAYNFWQAKDTRFFSSVIVDLKMDGYYSVPIVTLSDGSMWSFGRCNDGACGTNSTVASLLNQPTRVLESITGAPLNGTGGRLLMSSNRENALFVTAGGAIYAWGINNLLQLPLNTSSQQINIATASPFFDATTPSRTARSVCISASTTLVLAADGVVYGTGSNIYQLFGNSTSFSTLEPLAVQGLNGLSVQSLFCDAGSAFALLTNGDVWGWGANDFGNLGLGPDNFTSRVAPTRLPISDEGEVVQVTVMGNLKGVAFRMADGRVFVVGQDDYSGGGTNEDRRSVPIEVPAFSNQVRCVNVLAGYYSFAYVGDNGKVYSAGFMYGGETANGYQVAADLGDSSYYYSTALSTGFPGVAVTAAIGDYGPLQVITVDAPPSLTLVATSTSIGEGDDLQLSLSASLSRGASVASVRLVRADGSEAANCSDVTLSGNGTTVRCRVGGAADAVFDNEPLNIAVQFSCGPWTTSAQVTTLPFAISYNRAGGSNGAGNVATSTVLMIAAAGIGLLAL